MSDDQPNAEPTKKTLEDLERDLQEARDREDQNDIAMRLRDVAEFHFRQCDPDAALPLLNEALTLFESNKDCECLGITLLDIAQILSHQSKIDAAMANVDRASEIFRSIDSHKSQILAMHRRTAILLKSRRVDEATTITQEIMTFGRDTNDPKLLCLAHGTVTRLYLAMGQVSDALRLSRDGLELAQRTHNRAFEAEMLGILGKIERNRDNKVKAIKHLEDALAIIAEHDEDLREQEAVILYDLGLAYLENGKPLIALETYDKALAMHREFHNLGYEAITMNDIGYAYNLMGYPDKARPFLETALTLNRKAGNHCGVGTTYMNIAHGYVSLKAFDDAEQNMTSALNTYIELKDYRQQVDVFMALSSVATQKNDFDAAITYTEKASQLHLQNTNGTGSFEIFLWLLKRRRDWYQISSGVKRFFGRLFGRND